PILVCALEETALAQPTRPQPYRGLGGGAPPSPIADSSAWARPAAPCTRLVVAPHPSSPARSSSSRARAGARRRPVRGIFSADSNRRTQARLTMRRRSVPALAMAFAALALVLATVAPASARGSRCLGAKLRAI